MMRVPFEQLEAALAEALVPLGFVEERGALCARLFAETTRDGVYTHGLARFPRFAAMVRSGAVVAGAEAECVRAFGAMERWKGNRGAGNLNAHRAMERALELAREHGIGAVFLAQTNHWMRGGSYAWQAADAGCLSVCWTNTMPNLPAWGAREAVVGNNPLVMGVPRAGGEHVVLDMAMSQYSYGALGAYAARGEKLPFPGGFDAEGELTTDAAAIEASGRALPIGLWKGSGLAVMLDMFAAVLSGGLATCDIERDAMKESGVSQVFLVVAPGGFGMDFAAAERVIASLHAAPRVDEGVPVRYPGEQTIATRRRNLAEGVPVDEAIWERVLAKDF
jgi:3-dehydro-L-gulonate 2-dehydrogenase